MKPLFTVLFVFLFVSSFAQTQNSIEQTLISRFERILYWRDFQGDTKNISVYDSLFDVNDQFEKALETIKTKRFKRERETGYFNDASQPGKST
jgi:hypothetical protein